MKKLFMVLVLLLVAAPSSLAQVYPPAQGNSDVENYSFILPRLAYASFLFQTTLRQGGSDQLDAFDTFIVGPLCAPDVPGFVDLSGKTPTTWELEKEPGKITLKWFGGNAAAAGAVGSYTITYNAMRDSFDHQVSLQDANNAATLHWQSVLTAMIDAVDRFGRFQQPGRRPSMVLVKDQTISLSRGCEFDTYTAFQLKANPQVAWTLTHDPGFEGDHFIFDWQLPNEACGKAGQCAGSFAVEYTRMNQGFPFNITRIAVQ